MSRRLRAEVTVVIDRPVGEVFSALCEATTWPAWTRWASSVRVEPPGPVRGGSVVHVAKRGVGLGRSTVWQVTDIRPDRLIALEHDGDGRRMWLHLEPDGDATELTASVEVRSRSLLPFLRRRSEERALRADLRRLRALMGTSAGMASLLGARATVVDRSVPVTSLEAARRGR